MKFEIFHTQPHSLDSLVELSIWPNPQGLALAQVG